MSDDLPLGPLGDLTPEALRVQLHRMADWVADYRETLERRPIMPSVRPGDITGKLPAVLPAAPETLSVILRDLEAVVMPGIVHWGHPSFLGYFGSTSNGPALLGEIAAAALNVSAMMWTTSPAATELETVVLDWIRQMTGIPDRFTGIVYDTASVALAHALAAARERACVAVRARGIAGRSDVPILRVYASDQAHSSIEKAMILLGLGESNVVRVPSDGSFRLDVAALRAAIDADIARGYRPMAVVATVGTTSSASVDPVRAVAAICAHHELWLHVDAAYGGALGVLPEGRWAMDGTGLADSIVINAHKWLFVPLDFSALFTRHPDVLRSVFAMTPEYLRGDAAGNSRGGRVGSAGDGRDAGIAGRAPAIDYMDYGIQLGRRFRALKAWMVFRAFGALGIAARIREHCRLAALLAGWVDKEKDFALAAPPSMGIVCFRYAPAGVDADAGDRLNEVLVEAINGSGEVYITSTRLLGRTVMRVGIGNVLTTERHLERAWTCIRDAARTPPPRPRGGEVRNT